MIKPVIGEKYKHYKGGEYEIVGYAHHTETSEKMILYKPLYKVEDLEPEYPDGVVFTRPLSMFLETVERDDEIMPRFKLI